MIADYHCTRFPVLFQVLCKCPREILVGGVARASLCYVQSHCQHAGERFDVGRAQGKSTICLRAGRTGRALDHVQPAHIASIRIAPLGEVADVSRRTRKSRVQEIGIERNNYVGILQPVLRFNWLAEGHPRAFEHIVAVHRLVHMPLRLRIQFEHRPQLIGQRG